MTLVETTFVKAQPNWSNKTQVSYVDDSGQTLAEIQTKRREAIFLTLYAPAGTYALGQIADLGKDREIVPDRKGQDAIRIKVKSQKEVDSAEFKSFLDQFHADQTG
jgi:hypothetical protein